MVTKIKAAKVYKYLPSFLSGNNQISNLDMQLKSIKEIKVEILKQWKELLEKEKNDTDAMIVLNDINMFLFENNKAINEIHRQLNYLKKGSNGEDKVAEILYDFSNEWLYLSSIRINYNGNKMENDHIIIDATGVYTLEVKNIGNRRQKLMFDKYGRVERKDFRGKVIDQSDILAQSTRHLAYLNRFIKEHLDFNVPVEHIVVVASDIKIVNKSELNVVGLNTIYPYVKNNKKVLSLDERKIIYKTLLDNNIELAAYPITQYSEALKSNYILILESLQELKSNRKRKELPH